VKVDQRLQHSSFFSRAAGLSLRMLHAVVLWSVKAAAFSHYLSTIEIIAFFRNNSAFDILWCALTVVQT